MRLVAPDPLDPFFGDHHDSQGLQEDEGMETWPVGASGDQTPAAAGPGNGRDAGPKRGQLRRLRRWAGSKFG